MPFYPQGWTHDRLLNASGEDFVALSETQRTALFDGLKAIYGEDGFHEIMLVNHAGNESPLPGPN